jgi:hypothetical protein
MTSLGIALPAESRISGQPDSTPMARPKRIPLASIVRKNWFMRIDTAPVLPERQMSAIWWKFA